MTPSTPYHPFDSNMRVGNHMGNLNGMNNGNVAGTIGSYGNTPSTNGYGHKTIPSTPSVMSGLEKWGQDRYCYDINSASGKNIVENTGNTSMISTLITRYSRYQPFL